VSVHQSPLDDRGLPVGYDFNPQWEVTPRETKQLLDARAGGDEEADFVLIDCRLPHEVAITKIDGSELIPLQQIQQHADRLKEWQDRKIVVMCRSGGRSLQFTQILRRNGFHDVKSMAGGILLWNRDVNPGGPQY
jgi:rhodanese-related sulfurtransferase